MPELRCVRCRFWIPVERLERVDNAWVCDQCRGAGPPAAPRGSTGGPSGVGEKGPEPGAA